MTLVAPLLSLAAGVLPEAAPETTIDAAARAGFDAVGIWIEPASWTDARARDIARRVADAGIVILDAEVVWIRPGPLEDAALRVLDLSAIIGAPNLLTVSLDPDIGATADKFAMLCDRAAPAGIAVSLEFGAFTDIGDLTTALDVIRRANRPNARLLVDALHMSRSGGTPDDLRAISPTLFAYGQLCDAGPDAPDKTDRAAIRAEAIDGRLMPGDGVLPLVELIDAWPTNLPLSIELRSSALRQRHPDPTARARAVLDATRRWFAAHARRPVSEE